MKLSIVIPAKNEAEGLGAFLPRLIEQWPDAQIIVVNDGSSDHTSEVLMLNGVVEIKHPYSKGNGASIKSGARAASGDVIVFMDGDGQHRPENISLLLKQIELGYDMVVGARSRKSQASVGRFAANALYNTLATKMVGHNVKDLTSGFRAVKSTYFKQFLAILPNGFSYPTTITMAFFRAGYSVCYTPIEALERMGKSHIRIGRDGFRFLLIIFKITTLYSPLKLFVPASLMFFILGMSYYLFTYIVSGRFTNMSALMLTTAILVFLMGLISEQVTTLLYLSRSGPRETDAVIDKQKRKRQE